MSTDRSRTLAELTESMDDDALATGAVLIARIRRRALLAALIAALSATIPWYCVYGGVHGTEGPVTAIVVAVGLFFWTPMAAALLVGALALLGAPLPRSIRAHDVVWLAPHPVWSLFRRRLFTSRRAPGHPLLAPFRFFFRITRVAPLLQDNVVAKVGLADGRVFGVACPIEEFAPLVAELRAASPRLIVGGSREHRALFRRAPEAMSRAFEVAEADALSTIEHASARGVEWKRVRVVRAVVLEAIAFVVAMVARKVGAPDAFVVFAGLVAAAGFKVTWTLVNETLFGSSELADRVRKHLRGTLDPAYDATGVSFDRVGAPDAVEPFADVLREPSSIVGACAIDAFEADPPGAGRSDLVVVATSAPRLYVLDVGDVAGERVVDAIGLLAPHAEIGAWERFLRTHHA
jgi:hypothetical protein